MRVSGGNGEQILLSRRLLFFHHRSKVRVFLGTRHSYYVPLYEQVGRQKVICMYCVNLWERKTGTIYTDVSTSMKFN